jgi:dTDP-4-dehydrorhamnose 3,5-epimerase
VEYRELDIEGAFEFSSTNHGDARGLFREWFWNISNELPQGLDFNAKQGNLSMSNKNVLRGLHFSIAEEGQAKWVTAGKGRFLDVLVDLRTASPTFGNVAYVNLQSGNANSIYIPNGVGHSFLTLEDESILVYLLSSRYNPACEMTIYPLDPELEILWPINDPELSERDQNAMRLGEAKDRKLLPAK